MRNATQIRPSFLLINTPTQPVITDPEPATTNPYIFGMDLNSTTAAFEPYISEAIYSIIADAVRSE